LRTQTDAPNAMTRTPLRCSSIYLSNSKKATKVIGGIKEEEQIEKHKELKDLYLVCSPHLERILNGGNVDLDLLSLFPQMRATIMEGLRDRTSFWSTMEKRERE
jgi:hypothetical protein